MDNSEGKKTTLSFRLSEETLLKVKERFPEATGSEENFLKIFNGFLGAPASVVDIEKFVPVETYNSLVEECNKKDEVVERLQQIPTLEAPIVQEICSLVGVDSILDVPGKIKIINRAITYTETLFNALGATNMEQAIEAIKELKENNSPVLSENQFVINTTPIFEALMKETEQSLSATHKKEVTREDILKDMFMRYTILKWTEWFYPFCISNNRIVELSKSVNPELDSIEKVKGLFRGGRSE